jgi:glycine hydroxymethyltransferase
MILCTQALAKDIDKAIFPGTQGGPLMHIIAAKAVAFKEAMAPEFKTYQKQIILNADAMARRLVENGFHLVSGGTDNHLMLLDLRGKGITGKAAETALDAVGITVNKNAVPFDPEKPTITSGIRIGTPAVTTRGMKEKDMVEIADMITRILLHAEDEEVKKAVAVQVKVLSGKFPLYQ